MSTCELCFMHCNALKHDVILSRAGWKLGNRFAKYYLKPIEGEGHDEFQSAVLQLD